MKRLFNPLPFSADIGLLILRLFVGLTMLFSHGWGKMLRLFEDEIQFAEVLGMSATVSLVLAVFAEVICSALVALGLWTRLALVPLIITMLVAVFIIHADDPFSKQEFGLLYLVPYVTLFLTGPGRFSLDHKIYSS